MQRAIFLLAAALVAGPALAQPPRGEGGPPQRLFISPSGEPFRGGDGLATWFAHADADHDGAITPEEFSADAKAFFATMDVDHNGVLDGFEVQAYEQKIVPEITRLPFEGAGPGGGGERMGPPGGGRGKGGMGRGGGGRRGGMGGKAGGFGAGKGKQQMGAGLEGAARWSLLNEPQPLTGADTDIDGKVTAAEWAKATTRRFDHLDRAKAGRLTMDSLRPPATK